MYPYSILVILITFLNFSSTYAQEKLCGTITTQEDIDFINENMDLIKYYENEYYNLRQNKSSTALSSIPIQVHIVTNDDGSGGIDINDVLTELEEVNSYFLNSFVEFYVCDDVNYINSSSLYEFDQETQQDQLFSNHYPDILNLYFVDSISFGDGGACGYTYLPGNSNPYYDVVVMDNGCTTGNSNTTLTHEMGHHLNLIHTHGPQNGTLTNELVSGTNCLTAGDLLCDTPADPQLGYSNVNNVNCLYSESGTPTTDAQGNIFNPDTSNIMSYAPQECTDTLSEDQYARMYAGYHIYKNYYTCPSFGVSFTSNQNIQECGEQLVVEFSEDAFSDAISWEWDIDGDDIIDYTTESFTHTYMSPGSYDVSLKISNGTESITKVYPDYISFESNTYETSKIYLNVSVKNGINENTWEFKDSLGNILYSGGPYDSQGLYEYEFDAAQDCYTFTMYDRAGDGLTNHSWNLGSEYYELLDENNNQIIYGRDFGFEENTLIKNEYFNIFDHQNNSFFIFPNPTTEYVIVTGNKTINEFLIYDINGKLTKSEKINQLPTLNISLRGFNKGIYFIKIISNNSSSVKKLIIK